MTVIAHFTDIKAMFTLAIPDSFCAATKIITDRASVLQLWRRDFCAASGSLKWRITYRMGAHTSTV